MPAIDESKSEKSRPKGHMLYSFFYFLCVLNLLLNILGLPEIQYVFLAQISFFVLMIFLCDHRELIWAAVLLSIFEGQGRILMGYGVLYRLIFDIFLALIILRGMVNSKKLINRDITPNYLIIGIFLHFSWWILELFNPTGPVIFGALATSKYYIFPFILFFYLQNYPLKVLEEDGQRMLLSIVFVLTLVGVIVIIQNNQGEEFLYGISKNYLTIFPKFKNFVGEKFRPWGLGFVPGGQSTILFLSAGFFLLFKPEFLQEKIKYKKLFYFFLKWGGLGLIFFASFISQVRSATMKLVLIVVLSLTFKFIGNRLKARKAIALVLSLFVLVPFAGTFDLGLSFEGTEFQGAIERWEGLDEGSLTDHRAGIEGLIQSFDKQVNLPFGYGLGMTQSYLPYFQQQREQLVDVPLGYFWANDNLVFFLLLELGLGAVFYVFIIFAINLSLLSRLFTLLRWKEVTAFGIMAVCFSTVFVTTIFNWGAVGIPFNPESFYFWLWSGLGFNTYIKVKEKRRLGGEEVIDETEHDSFESAQN